MFTQIQRNNNPQVFEFELDLQQYSVPNTK